MAFTITTTPLANVRTGFTDVKSILDQLQTDLNVATTYPFTATDWNPTYSASGAMTFTSVTTTYAKYVDVGGLRFISLSATGTAGGTASIYLGFTLPSTPVSMGETFTASVRDNSIDKGGFCIQSSGATYYVSRYDNANFTLGSVIIRVQGFYLR